MGSSVDNPTHVTISVEEYERLKKSKTGLIASQAKILDKIPGKGGKTHTLASLQALAAGYLIQLTKTIDDIGIQVSPEILQFIHGNADLLTGLVAVVWWLTILARQAREYR